MKQATACVREAKVVCLCKGENRVEMSKTRMFLIFESLLSLVVFESI